MLAVTGFVTAVVLVLLASSVGTAAAQPPEKVPRWVTYRRAPLPTPFGFAAWRSSAKAYASWAMSRVGTSRSSSAGSRASTTGTRPSRRIWFALRCRSS